MNIFVDNRFEVCIWDRNSKDLVCLMMIWQFYLLFCCPMPTWLGSQQGHSRLSMWSWRHPRRCWGIKSPSLASCLYCVILLFCITILTDWLCLGFISYSLCSHFPSGSVILLTFWCWCKDVHVQDGYCKMKNVTVTARMKGFVNVTSGDLDALKMAIAVHGPVSVAIDAAHRSLVFYANGVYYEPQCGKAQLLWTHLFTSRSNRCWRQRDIIKWAHLFHRQSIGTWKQLRRTGSRAVNVFWFIC